MKSYQDLINECPELGDIIAELVGEVDFLNNLHTPAYSSYETPPHKIGKPKEPPPEDKEYLTIGEFKRYLGRLNWIANRINAHVDASEKAKKDKEQGGLEYKEEAEE